MKKRRTPKNLTLHAPRYVLGDLLLTRLIPHLRSLRKLLRR
ncbi:hypothetical protein J3R03_003688 [Actinoplanes couchii]|nr:hypothetical protein [Actinoplanes couchii]